MHPTDAGRQQGQGVAWGHLCCARKEWDATAKAGPSCCHVSSSLCSGTFQMKVKQDEEKKQLCSLRDQLKTALQLDQKEVKSDPSCEETGGGACRRHGMAAAYIVPACQCRKPWGFW